MHLQHQMQRTAFSSMWAAFADYTKRPISLLMQFVLIAALVLVAGMVAIGFWVKAEIEKVVITNAGGVTALYVDAMIAPVTQGMAEREMPTESERAALGYLLRQGALRNEIHLFNLWDLEGRVVYSDNAVLVGQSLPISPGLAQVLAGGSHAEISAYSHASNENGTVEQAPLLEIYSPIRSADTGEVIAVAEFYSAVETLNAQLFEASFKSWLVVGLVSLLMFSALSLLVARGSRTIASQRNALDEKIADLSSLLEHNRGLSERVDQANSRIAHLHERYLRRISADLHDGPAQHLAFAALRLDGPGEARHEQVRQAVNEALEEIRLICQGFALPDLDDWSPATIVNRLASAHEARTGLIVEVELERGLPPLSIAAKTCLYRFVQEGLNNIARHASGARHEIGVQVSGNGLVAHIHDDGPGFDTGRSVDRLGLAGLRERVAVLKGRFDISSGWGKGTTLSIWLPCDAGAEGP